MHNAISYIFQPVAMWNCLAQITSSQDFLFWFLFTFRYLRLVVHTIAFVWIYKPTPVPASPTLSPTDCSVVIPTVDPGNSDFLECLHSVLMNRPGAVIIVTVGKANLRVIKDIRESIRHSHPATTITCIARNVANKRRQICAALPHITTKITLFVDDHVFWPSTNFLPTALAPFEDPTVGCVGTSKRVRREHTGPSLRSFFNFLGCVYLERQNFITVATNAIDGGAMVSGRTSVHRTAILQDPGFVSSFQNEMFFFGKFGPLISGDDNFRMRWSVMNHWKIKIQYCDDAMIETTLGAYPKYLSQCLRWARNTWRSNSTSLFTERTVCQPWCVYALYITNFFNFALFYDAAMMYTLYHHTSFGTSAKAMALMGMWIFVSKMVKLAPQFWRHPADMLFIPGYLAFAYWHSLIKLYALLTLYVTVWNGRNLEAVGKDDGDEEDTHNDGVGNLVSDIGSSTSDGSRYWY